MNFYKLFILLTGLLRINIAKNYESRQKYHKLMERIQVLIQKLTDQVSRGESTSQLLMTVHLLQQELMLQQKKNVPAGTSKVAVVMPAFPFSNLQLSDLSTEDKEVYELKMEETDLYNTESEEPAQKIISLKDRNANNNLKTDQDQQGRRLAAEVITPKEEQPVSKLPGENTNINHRLPERKKELPHLPFAFDDEAPTLMHQKAPARKEVHEVIGQKKDSLNDKLKQEKIELAHVLKDAPIKDLRKGIGVNDKFVFLNELFRGDEAMYERSIKTINSFHILPEAEYWMNRELKVKLGWSDNKEVVQHFYAVVRRRFS
jgi:hypothetical protein